MRLVVDAYLVHENRRGVQWRTTVHEAACPSCRQATLKRSNARSTWLGPYATKKDAMVAAGERAKACRRCFP